MDAKAGTGAPPIPILNGTLQRVIISLLAAVLALIHVNLMPDAASSAARGDYSTATAVGGTRILLACHGHGPVTVAIISPTAVELVIDDAVQAQLARSVRLCSVTANVATASAAPDLTRLLPALLYEAHARAPYVIVSTASVSALFNRPEARIPFIDRVAGWVLVDPAPAPAGLCVSADERIWPLPAGDRDKTALAILSLFWPPEE
jgi:hypothetical protein